MRRLTFVFILFLCMTSIFSQSEEDIFSSGEDFNIDDLFEIGSEEIQAPVVTETNETVIKVNDFSIPLKFSGSLTADLGYGYVKNKAENDSSQNGYIDFQNYLYLTAFPTSDLGLRGSFYTSFPNYQFEIYELYFDWLVLDKLYVTAGKKATTWGNVRLFTTSENDSELDKRNFGFETNILSASRNGTSILLRLPVWTGTISGIVMYPGRATQPKIYDMYFAGSIEMTIGQTVVNLFGKKFPGTASDYCPKDPLKDDAGNLLKDSTGKQLYYYKNGLLGGLELKRTILDADVYGQGIVQFYDNQKVKDALKFDIHKDSFCDMVYTVGLYKWWDKFDPNIGFNIEFQDEYLPYSNLHDRRFGFDGGVKRLGPKKNIKVGAEWMHSFTTKKGYAKPGIIISGILPHADWNNGIKFEYEDGSLKKATFGTYLELSLNY